jgi:hypothetical protein
MTPIALERIRGGTHWTMSNVPDCGDPNLYTFRVGQQLGKQFEEALEVVLEALDDVVEYGV